MLNIIKNIFSDISLIYRNFLHWNISKVLIYFFAFILWIVLTLPFLLVFWLFIFFDPIDWKDIISTYISTQSVWLSLLTAFSVHYIYLIIEWFLLILWFLSFSFWYAYYILSLSNLYFNYVKWEKLPYFKNIYFNLSVIKKYIYMLSWWSLFLIIPILVFVLWFFITLFVFWWLDEVYLAQSSDWVNMFSVIVWIIFLVCLLAFVYISYRITFAYLIYLDERNSEEVDKKSLYYIKKSFEITWWLKIFKFLLFMVIFTIILLPVQYLTNYLEDVWWITYFLYSVITFLTISWLFEMFFLSVYRNLMKK